MTASNGAQFTNIAVVRPAARPAFRKDGASELSGIGVLSSTPWVAGSMPRNMVV
jgi:hypothetical protein